nr:carboxyltransferase domain-containing protein [Corynebacterium jeikeium]
MASPRALPTACRLQATSPTPGTCLVAAPRAPPFRRGAVGLAGQFSAVYPRTSPGGWQLLATPTQPMWDTNAEQPALLQPGDTVRYRQVRESHQR